MTAASTRHRPLPPLPGVFAVVGCDGSGKTTLVHDLVAALATREPARRRYMGLVSGEAGDRIKRLPLIGIRLERHLAARSRRAQDMGRRLPGPFTALVMYGLSWWRAWQLARLVRMSGRGTLIVADRWPQAEVPGFHYDGPGLRVDRSSNRLVQRLARSEQRLYERMARVRPALVLRLTVDAGTAHGRKPDHPLPELVDKIEHMALIAYNGARLREVDARQPYAGVREAALAEIAAARAATDGG